MPVIDTITFDLFALGRGLASAAMVALLGTCVFAALIPRWRQDSDNESSLSAHALARCWRVALVAALILIVAHLLRGYGQVSSFLDPPEYFSLEAARTILTDADRRTANFPRR